MTGSFSTLNLKVVDSAPSNVTRGMSADNASSHPRRMAQLTSAVGSKNAITRYLVIASVTLIHKYVLIINEIRCV